VFCPAGVHSLDSSVHICPLGTIAGLPEESQQNDQLATRFPEGDPPGSAVERNPQFVDAFSGLQASTSGSRSISIITSIIYILDGKSSRVTDRHIGPRPFGRAGHY
jgi:hypothetical protein